MAEEDEKKLPETVGLALVPKREEMIADISALEPAYESYLERIPKEKRQRIFNSLNRIRTGLHAVAPIMCLGAAKCPFIERCPIPERGPNQELQLGADSNYPIGQECILEKFFMQQKIIEYVEHLNVDPGNPVEMSIVNELALIDLYKNRSLMIMAVGDKSGQGRDFMRVDVIGFNEAGDRAETAKLHPAVDMLDKLEKRREKWLEKLMETRKSKADWLIKIGNPQSESKILAEIQGLREAISQLETTEVRQIETDGDDELLLD